MNYQGIRHKEIISYLRGKGWQLLNTQDKFVRLLPPVSLDFPETYSLIVPTKANTSDYQRNIQHTVKIISEIYNISETKLINLLIQDGTILSFRFADEKTANGSLSFRHFEGFLENIKKAFLDIASATALNTPFIEGYTMEAENYINHCRYLQTEHGSFVTNIQLPSELILREQLAFFETSPLIAEQVTERIYEYLKFTAESVLENNEQIYDDTFIKQEQDFLSVQIFEDIDGVIKKANSKNIYITFTGKAYSKEVKVENLSPEKYTNLSNYIKFLKQEVEENIAMDIVGKIVELRSRNPYNDNNYIVVRTLFENQSILLAMHLDNINYQKAIQAHRNNREVNIRGYAKRMKTQYKITSLDYLGEI